MHRHNAFFMGAISAAIKTAARLHPMADDLAPAMIAFRSQGVDCAFKAIEIM